VWELTGSLTASTLAGGFLLFDVGMLILNRYILLDPILLFFISGAGLACAKFRNLHADPAMAFTPQWWTWLALTGVALGGAISVKFVGLFIILLVGLETIRQLWEILGDLSLPFSNVIRHFVARAVCLILLPMVMYVFIFWIHLQVLYKR